MTQITFPLPKDENQIKEIMGVVREISGSKTRIEGERDYIKEAVKELSEKHQIPKKLLNKFISDYHKSKFAESIGTNDEYQALVASLQPKAFGEDQGN